MTGVQVIGAIGLAWMFSMAAWWLFNMLVWRLKEDAHHLSNTIETRRV